MHDRRKFVLVSLLVLALPAWQSFAATAIYNSGWSGGTGAGGAPGPTDDVLIQAGDLTWDTNSLPDTVHSWTQDAAYNGTVTFATKYGSGFTVFTITADCALNNGAWKHLDNTTVEANRLCVSVGGNFTLAAAARIWVDSLGYQYEAGPGRPVQNVYRTGGSYGGIGGYGTGGGDNPGPTYGSITCPTNLGSGASVFIAPLDCDGGGAVFLTVGGAALVDGVISANGTNTLAQASGGGSGGSVYMRAGSLSGSGTIRASGGLGNVNNGSSGGGGGGRVAVVLTGAATFGSVVFQAFGGTNGGYYGAAGTVYLERNTDAPGRGHLIVNNNDSVTDRPYVTDLNGITPVQYDFSELTLTNAGVLRIGPGCSLTLTNAIIHSDSADNQDRIRLSGGTLRVDNSFALSNFVISIDATNSTFSPATSFTIGSNGEFWVNQPHVMTSSVTVASGGLFSHEENPNAELYKIDLTLVGNLTVDAGGQIDVTARGWQRGSGPGSTNSTPYRYGASYGGRGGPSGEGYNPGPTYGYITTPTNCGSGGGWYLNAISDGGGAVKLNVSGTTTINGLVAADGTNSFGLAGQGATGGGSGGSVFLTTGSLLGSGTIRSNGGPGQNNNSFCGGGGGGRVALVLTGSDIFPGGMTVQAFGGAYPGWSGAAGTIYLQKQSDTPGQGELLVDNNDTVAAPGKYTDLSGVADVSYTFSRLTLRNAGVILVATNDSLNIAGAVLTGDSADKNEGIRVDGGALTVANAFSFSNFFVSIDANGPAFHPTTSVTIGDKADLLLNKPYSLTCDVTVASGGVLRHGPNTTTEANKLDLNLTGNLTIQSGGAVNVNTMGYTGNNGPGTPLPSGGNRYRAGGSYGGMGSRSGGADSGYPGPTYGSIVAPTNLGSGGGQYTVGIHTEGGGAVKLAVSGTTTLDGFISADGTNDLAVANSGGAGGSVWLTTSTLSGAGSIRAIGGPGWADGPGGGGGRISVILTGSDTFGSITTLARGGLSPNIGSTDGSAGTIYLQGQSQGSGRGTLTIDNASQTANRVTDITSNVTDRVVGDVRILGNATLQVNTNQSLTVYGSWSNAASFTALFGSTVQMAGTNTAQVYGNQTFQALVCTNGGKRMEFKNGQTNGVLAGLTLRGALGNPLMLRSSSGGQNWFLKADGNAVQSLDSDDVRDSDARPGATISTVNSTDAGNNFNWSFAVTGATNYWIGAVSRDWGTAGNWSLARGPIPDDSATVISNACPYYPVLTAPKTVNKFTILSGASLTLNGQDFTAQGDAIIAGSLIASNTETITLGGQVDFTGGTFARATSLVVLNSLADQSVTAAGNAFHRLTATNAARTVTFTDALTLNYLRCQSVSAQYQANVNAGEIRIYSDSGAVTQRFASASTCTVRELFLLGASGKTIFVRSSGVAWSLNVTGQAYVKYVDAQYSDASGGRKVYAIQSTDSGSNPNWDFGSTWAQWVGNVSTDFNTAGNWNPSGVPGSSTRVLVDATNQMVLSAPATVRALIVGGDNATLATANAALTVGETIDVLRFGQLALNRPGNSTAGDGGVFEGGLISHGANTTTENNKLELAIGGNLNVYSNGQISVVGLGYSGNNGPGTPVPNVGIQYRCSASHGGMGSRGTDAAGGFPGRTYGSIVAPTNLGSGGGMYVSPPLPNCAGGGAIKLTVSSAATVNGLICADGTNTFSLADGGGAGGSIWLTTASLAGSGQIHANGGPGYFDGYACPGGGGGRVSVVLTATDSFGGVVVQAAGGVYAPTYNGAAGTVYLQTQTQGAGHGTLIVDNAGLTANRTTDISSNVTDAVVGDVQIRNAAVLQLNTNQSLTVSGSWSNGASLVTLANSTVRFVGPATATVYGNQSFQNLICTNAGKTLQFAAGQTNAVAKTLTLTGESGNRLVLRSFTPTQPWFLNSAVDTVQTVDWVDVQDSDARPGSTISALHSTDSGRNFNWTFAAAGVTNTWIGAVSTDWGVGGNWDQNRAPIPQDIAVVISNGCPFYPVLTAPKDANDFIIRNGAALTLNGNNLSVYGNAVLAGSLVATGTETILFLGGIDLTGGTFTRANSTVLIGGSGGQTITAAGAVFWDLVVTNSTTPVTFADTVQAEHYRSDGASVRYQGGFTAAEFRVTPGSGSVTQTFWQVNTYNIQRLYVLGAPARTVYLTSLIGTWTLNVTKLAYVKYANVGQSDASGGLTIYPIASTDATGNINWVFGAPWSVWVGAGSTDFDTAGNWNPSGVPAANARLLVDVTNELVMALPHAVTEVLVGGSTNAVMTCNAALTITNNLTVARQGLVRLNQPGNAVSNRVLVLQGGMLSHSDNNATEQYKLDAKVGGDLIVESGAAVDVTARGYHNQTGPGTASYYRTGGSYGGVGGSGNGANAGTPGPTYGSITTPTNCGSGGGWYQLETDGGGAIKLVVAGTTYLDGTIAADGENLLGIADGGGAGGSVWLTTGQLSGSGKISADGGVGSGNQGPNPGGGGGRIAVCLTGSDSFGGVSMETYGGLLAPNFSGAAGTIYLQKASDPAGHGELIVNNADRLPFNRECTDINGLTAASYAFGRLTLTNAGVLRVGPDDAVTLTGAVIRADASDANEGIRLSGGTLRVDPIFGNDQYFVAIDAPNSSFSPGASFMVGAGSEFIVNRPHSVTCDVTVAAGGMLRHDSNGITESNKVDLVISGNLTVQSGGYINVDARGYQSSAGPGAPLQGASHTVYRCGGAYGGASPKSSTSDSGDPGPTYGSAVAPTNCGSGSGYYQGNGAGGGALRLRVSGATLLNGTMSANGTNTSAQVDGGGAGGSVWLSTATLAGSGTITADGGPGTQPGGPSPGGGGGRVAVYVTAGTDYGAVTMHARGGTQPTTFWGGAGTVYREASGRKDFIVENGGSPTNAFTWLPAQSGGMTNQLTRAVMTVSNGAHLRLSSAETVGNVFVYTNSAFSLDTYNLYVNSLQHPLGGGVTNSLGGIIIWLGSPRGAIFVVR